MRTIARRASLGGNVRTAALIAFTVGLPSLGLAQEYTDGQEAYAQRDWAAAETLWLREAEGGSAEALLGLGNLYDFGLLGVADPVRAFDLYSEAAKAGLSEAAFNVAIMHDMGIGTSKDLGKAASWYSFAALGGNPRAAYNLGRFFADGIGVSRNDALAAYWYGTVAGTLPSAEVALAALPTRPRTEAEMSAPEPLLLETFSTPSGPEARMAWQDRSSFIGATYHVDLIGIGPEGFGPWTTAQTPGSALSMSTPPKRNAMAWRVSQVTAEGYAASEWSTADGVPMATPPSGIVRFEFEAGDRRAEGLAYRLGGAMERFGSIVAYVPAATGIESSSVSYGYVQDADFAMEVAAFVPGIGLTGAALLRNGDIAPEEVRIRLAFAPDGG